MSLSSGFVFKVLSHRKLKFNKGPKFGYHWRIFWSDKSNGFNTIKFVTFFKSYVHILESHAKAKSYLIFPALSILQQKIFENLKTYSSF